MLKRGEHFKYMRNHLNQPRPDLAWNIFLVAVFLGCVIGIVWLLSRWQQASPRATRLHPMALYRRVAAKLGLSVVDRWWLWRLARVVGVDHPTALLISVRQYDQSVRQYHASRGWLGRRAGAGEHFASIRSRLFETDAGPWPG